MRMETFNAVVAEQLSACEELLTGKGYAYAPDAMDENSADRLAHFKKAAALMNCSEKEALFGMLVKHLVSISDMCASEQTYSLEHWTEKITDSINYLLLLKAVVLEGYDG